MWRLTRYGVAFAAGQLFQIGAEALRVRLELGEDARTVARGVRRVASWLAERG